MRGLGNPLLCLPPARRLGKSADFVHQARSIPLVFGDALDLDGDGIDRLLDAVEARGYLGSRWSR
jgi:hypothetical protein